MRNRQLRQLLDGLSDTQELVLHSPDHVGSNEHEERLAIWSAARAEANTAYDCWRRERNSEAYVVYRAAEDRADAAQTQLK
jgi:hypothetical protein